MMLFISTSSLKSLIQYTLDSSWASCLLHRIHVAVSCHFLGFSGSHHRLIPCGQHASGAPPSMVQCAKLSVHIFVCWKVTPEASFSALMVTESLLLTLHTIFFCSTEAHTIKRRRYLSGAHTFLRGSLAFETTGPTQHSCAQCTQWALCPRRDPSHFCAHWHSTFVYLTFVLVLTAQMFFCHFLESWSGTLKGK